MDTGQFFIDHARYKLMQDYWPKVQQCVELLSDDHLWWRPNANSNSVGNILLHLCGNLRQWIIHGLGGSEDKRNRPAEFAEKGPIPAHELLNRLQHTLEEVDQTLATVDASTLLQPRVIQGFEVNSLAAIFHVVEHFAQHLGQISYITKMRCDVDLNYFDLSGERGLSSQSESWM